MIPNVSKNHPHVQMLVVALFSCILADTTRSARAETAANSGQQHTYEASDDVPYVPTLENLASREWFQDAKFGIFVHWGTYSVLARGEWVMHNERMSTLEYDKVPAGFNPTKYDAAQWTSLFKRSGAKYVTFTARHADGFAMWDSKVTDWDVVDRTPYGRDVLKQLTDECRRQDLGLFLYYSQVDWHHPDYYPLGTTGQYSSRPNDGNWNRYVSYMHSQLTELLNGGYGRVRGIWFDGWWDQQATRLPGHEDADTKLTAVDWHLRRTYDLIHLLEPACLIGTNHHIEPFAGEDFQMFERDLPGENKSGHSPNAKIGNLPLETCDTMNNSWGYNASDMNYKSTAQLIQYLVRAAGQNANFLLNVGPRQDGTIDPQMARRLEEIGEWMSQYGHTIYGTRGGPTGLQPWGTSTQTSDVVYLHILDRSAADGDGWLRLTGTDSLAPRNLRTALDGKPVAARGNGDGLLELKIDSDSDLIDLVLIVQKANGRQRSTLD
jgi:alpha-L-fucosidase